MPDPEERARPLNHHERKRMILKPEENSVQPKLDGFNKFVIDKRFFISKNFFYTMVLSRFRNFDFPPEFFVGDSECMQVTLEV